MSKHAKNSYHIRKNLSLEMRKEKSKSSCLNPTHKITESFMLEKTFKIIRYMKAFFGLSVFLLVKYGSACWKFSFTTYLVNLWLTKNMYPDFTTEV